MFQRTTLSPTYFCQRRANDKFLGTFKIWNFSFLKYAFTSSSAVSLSLSLSIPPYGFKKLKEKVSTWFLPYIRPWRWRRYAVHEMPSDFNELHGIMSYKTELFITTALGPRILYIIMCLTFWCHREIENTEWDMIYFKGEKIKYSCFKNSQELSARYSAKGTSCSG
jgi:hypothetical protein